MANAKESSQYYPFNKIRGGIRSGRGWRCGIAEQPRAALALIANGALHRYTPPVDYCDEDKENVARVQLKSTTKKRRLSAAMEGISGDAEATPRPNKRRLVHDDVGEGPPEQFPSTPSLRSDASSELESHQSGRLSPTKQLATLEDREDPIVYSDFASTKAKVPDDDHELADLTGANGGLEIGERHRFSYSWVNDLEKRRRTGRTVPLSEVQRLTAAAIICEEGRSHEGTWNEKVHQVAIQAALASSAHAKYLDVASAKTASIDPKSLASEALPRRVVDYAIVLVPDELISRAWKKLRPLPGAGIKSWNHTTTNDLRSSPMASSVETKAPNKSWTDGKAQLAIWTSALHKRLSLLQTPGQGHLRIPAMPLLIAQGHDWHLLIVSRQPHSDDEDGSETIIWQKIDVGSTRNCFDAYKLLAVLHVVADWAYTIWRPWFRELIGWSVP
ncbi:MAG: hypothetical protein Q9208_006791 [Pyrenodesmia sp. 3 TL-2023]